ncbi:hypothetical protein C4580_02080, partial [Candidatus Woesearchaeota archaeon]
MKAKALFFFLALLLVPFAAAEADITYQFVYQDQIGVPTSFNTTAFTCLDSDCGQVNPFAGSFLTGPATTSGSVVI